jgi:hypothetical protein
LDEADKKDMAGLTTALATAAVSVLKYHRGLLRAEWVPRYVFLPTADARHGRPPHRIDAETTYYFVNFKVGEHMPPGAQSVRDMTKDAQQLLMNLVHDFAVQTGSKPGLHAGTSGAGNNKKKPAAAAAAPANGAPAAGGGATPAAASAGGNCKGCMYMEYLYSRHERAQAVGVRYIFQLTRVKPVTPAPVAAAAAAAAVEDPSSSNEDDEDDDDDDRMAVDPPPSRRRAADAAPPPPPPDALPDWLSVGQTLTCREATWLNGQLSAYHDQLRSGGGGGKRRKLPQGAAATDDNGAEANLPRPLKTVDYAWAATLDVGAVRLLYICVVSHSAVTCFLDDYRPCAALL